MKMMRICAAAGSMLLTFCTLTGCGESQPAEIVTEDAMPYGATITESTALPIAFSYDSRFVDDELLNMIYSYYHAIEERDAETFTSLMFPIYHKYQMETVYDNSVTEQEILDATHDAINEYFGFDTDFLYCLIDITELYNKQGVSDNRDLMTMMLDKIAQDAGEPLVSEETQALYEMHITRYVDKAENVSKSVTDYALKDEILYAIQYQDKWYLMYS